MRRICRWLIEQAINALPTPLYMRFASWQIEKGWWLIEQAINALPTPLYMRFAGWQIEKGWMQVQLIPTGDAVVYVKVVHGAVCGPTEGGRLDAANHVDQGRRTERDGD